MMTAKTTHDFDQMVIDSNMSVTNSSDNTPSEIGSSGNMTATPATPSWSSDVTGKTGVVQQLKACNLRINAKKLANEVFTDPVTMYHGFIRYPAYTILPNSILIVDTIGCNQYITHRIGLGTPVTSFRESIKDATFVVCELLHIENEHKQEINFGRILSSMVADTTLDIGEVSHICVLLLYRSNILKPWDAAIIEPNYREGTKQYQTVSDAVATAYENIIGVPMVSDIKMIRAVNTNTLTEASICFASPCLNMIMLSGCTVKQKLKNGLDAVQLLSSLSKIENINAFISETLKPDTTRGDIYKYCETAHINQQSFTPKYTKRLRNRDAIIDMIRVPIIVAKTTKRLLQEHNVKRKIDKQRQKHNDEEERRVKACERILKEEQCILPCAWLPSEMKCTKLTRKKFRRSEVI